MAKRPDLTHTQRQIVDRYYQHKGTILSTKLGEIVSDLSLATDPKKAQKLWDRARTALVGAGVEPAKIARIVDARNLEELARVVNALAGPRG